MGIQRMNHFLIRRIIQREVAVAQEAQKGGDTCMLITDSICMAQTKHNIKTIIFQLKA